MAIATFELGSLVCGAAPTSTALIVGRAVAGLGSAGVFMGGVMIISHTVPLVRRPIYVGIIGGRCSLSPLFSPVCFESWET